MVSVSLPGKNKKKTICNSLNDIIYNMKTSTAFEEFLLHSCMHEDIILFFLE
jgi:hypothetical protein